MPVETAQKRLCMGCMAPLEPAVGRCPRCGFDNSAPASGEFLRPGSVLTARYIVGRLISSNGEGAFYLGYDKEEDCKVWIAEYAPDTLCRRNEATGVVAARSGREAQYKSLMYDFIENAQILRGLRQNGGGGIIPVLDMAGCYGTAYTVYRYIEGVPLQEYLGTNGGTLAWAKVKPMMIGICKSLLALHTQGAIHRGVSPATMLVDTKGRLWLGGMAISAARTGMSEVCCELFEGYSAPEQYSATGKQGAWTDVYSCAAVLYRMLTGMVPVSAEMRKERDTLYPANMIQSAVPADVSAAIDGAMLVNPDKRTLSMDKFIAELLEESASNTAVFDGAIVPPQNKPQRKNEGYSYGRVQARRPVPFWLRAMLLTCIALGALVLVLGFTVLRPVLFPQPEVSSSVSEEEPPPESSVAALTVPEFTDRLANSILQNPQYLESFTFETVEEFNEDGIPKGVVISQSVPAGITVEEKSKIVLTVSRGSQLTTMPYLLNLTEEAAKQRLDELNIRYQIIQQPSADGDPGTVLKTSVPAGSQVMREHDTVFITIRTAASPQESSEDEGKVGGYDITVS